MLSTVDRTSPRLLLFLLSLFWDEPIIPTNYFYTCYSLLVGFIPLGNHHSRARIFKARSMIKCDVDPESRIINVMDLEV